MREGVLLALPSLDEGTMQNLLMKLKTLGVEKVEDLGLLQFEDLTDILKTIQVRKLLRHNWNQEPSVGDDLSTYSVTSSNPTSPTDSTGSSKACSPITFTRMCNQDPNWAYKVSIPWDELPEGGQYLDHGQRLPANIRRLLVRLVVDVVRKNSEHATKRQFAVIAQRMVSRYPSSLQDKIDDIVIGTGYDSIQQQMITRNENLNRVKDNVYSLKRNANDCDKESDGPATCKKAKQCAKPKNMTDAYGCVNWDPTVHFTDLPELEKVQNDLQNMFLGDPQSYSWPNIEEMMDKTFGLQRQLINYSGKAVDGILKEWPFLKEENGILNHFKKLVGVDCRTAIADAYAAKGPRLNRFFTCSLCPAQDVNKQWLDLANVQTAQDNVTAYIPVLILCLIASLQEEESSLFLVVDVTSTPADVERINTINWPRMAILGNSYLEGQEYMVLVDGRVVVSKMTGFLSSLAVLFASYYVFNIQYPAEAAASLEFIQRCFIEINPDKGNKTNKRKRSSSVNPKVLKMINAIASFEWNPSKE